MSSGGTYKPEGHTIVTVPMCPELHRKLRIYAAQNDKTIKQAVTELVEAALVRCD